MHGSFRSSLFAIAVLLAACGGAEDRKTVYFNKGKELFAAENYEKARVEFQNALQIEPKDLEVRMALAETMEKLENWQGAARQYLGILNEDDKHTGALTNLGRLYLLGNNDNKAREHAERILSVDADHTAAKTLLAGVEAKAGNRERAEALVDEVLSVQPHDPEAASLKSSLQLFAGDTDAAVHTLEQAVTANPAEPGLRINLARVNARAGRQEPAIEVFRGLLEEEPDNLGYRHAFAKMLTAFGRVDDADAVFAQAINDFPAEQQAKLAYIEFLTGTRGVDRAVEELEALIEAEPAERRYRFALGRIHEATSAFDEAAALYRAIINDVDEGPDLLRAKTRLAVVSTRQLELAEARRLVDEVLEENPRDIEALTLRGTLLLNDGDAVGAIADLRTVLGDEPREVRAVRLLARAHQTNNEPELALDVLQRGVADNPGAAILGLDLANLLSARDRLDDALAALDGVLERQPNSAPALEGKFKIHLHRKDHAAAMTVAEAFKTALPNDPRGHYFAGLMHRQAGDLEASLGAFDEALATRPGAVQALSELVKTLIALERRDEALARLTAIANEHPEHFVAHNLAGEMHLGAGDFELAEGAFRRAIEIRPGWAIPYRNLATTLVATERREEAIELMRTGIEASGGSALLLTSLAAFYEQSGDLDAAIEEYERALEEKPDSVLTANNLAMLLAEYRDDRETLERARTLVEPLRNTDQPAFLDTVGWIEYKLGAYEQARLFIEKAIEGAPNSRLLHYHLGMVYHATGNNMGAKEHLERALESNAAFKGADEARAVLAELGAQ